MEKGYRRKKISRHSSRIVKVARKRASNNTGSSPGLNYDKAEVPGR